MLSFVGGLEGDRASGNAGFARMLCTCSVWRARTEMRGVEEEGKIKDWIGRGHHGWMQSGDKPVGEICKLVRAVVDTLLVLVDVGPCVGGCTDGGDPPGGRPRDDGVGPLNVDASRLQHGVSQ